MVPPAQSPKVPDSGILYPGAERCNCVHKIADGDPGGGQTMYSTMLSCRNECAIENRWRPPNSIVTRCMKDYGTGISCSKNFPRSYMEETVMDQNSYPSYRRRPNRFSATVKHPLNRRETVTVGNKWVVPYNPKYKAHFNVEICGTIRAIRYIHKYIYKGSDRATIELDEIKQYVNCRYLGSSEGIWRFFAFDFIPIEVEYYNEKDLQFQPTSVAFCTGTVSFKEGASGSMPTINVRAYHLNMYASTVTNYIAPPPQSLTL
ncbi:hypothetical protein Egran_05812 [Elaphomyces granulatus]|uniref:Uncharacterized protein n=1 Tax=Elaphomyces granulatus TaxID=519963 RepID=A0A232LQI0_9EURO|nr:hypothetical protein Egran_05812 [Elaphomyces granulatus]